MSKRLHKVLQDLTGQPGEGGFIVEGDEWWLNMEFQPEHETRAEWRSRTFIHRFGQRSQPFKFFPISAVTPEEAIEFLDRFKEAYPGFSWDEETSYPADSEGKTVDE